MNVHRMKCFLFLFTLFVSSYAYSLDVKREFNKLVERTNLKVFVEYNKQLRSTPDISGQIEFRLKISEKGRLTSCEVTTSELKSPAFEKKICELYKKVSYMGISEKPTEFMHRLKFLSE